MLRILLLTLMATLALHATATGVDVANRAITVPIYQEPRSLDSSAAPTVEFTAEILAHIQEGLMRLDARRRVVGGVAESWELTPTAVRFQLRADARWENGEPVTAHDFVFAWRRLVTPATGSQSANLASPIVNALAILRGEKTPETLGVRAISDRELVIDLAHPCNWCLKVMTTSAFYPINEKFFNEAGEEFGSSAKTHLSNGPFRLADWQRGMTITLQKNKAYWGRDRVHLEQVHYGYLANDSQSLLNLYRSGDIAVAELSRDTVEEGLKLGQRLKTGPTGYLMHLQFSHVDGMASANENIRKAVALVIDKQDLVNRIVASPGTRVAEAMFHEWMAVGNEKFGRLVDPVPHVTDLEKARAHLALARKELGLPADETISLTFTIFDSSIGGRVAEYLQQRLALVGVNLRIDPQTVQMLLDKWFKGTSDITMIGWIPDVDDPIDQLSFLGNPDIRGVFQGLYTGEDMTAIYYSYRDATSDEERLAVVRRAHKFFMDRVTVIPLFESWDSTLVDPRVRGYVFQPVRAFNDYRYIRLVE